MGRQLASKPSWSPFQNLKLGFFHQRTSAVINLNIYIDEHFIFRKFPKDDDGGNEPRLNHQKWLSAL